MFRTSNSPDPVFTSKLSLKLEDIRPSLAGPKRPQDRVLMEGMADNFSQALDDLSAPPNMPANKRVTVKGEKFDLGHGDVAIAADNVLHEHIQSLRHDWRGASSTKMPSPKD